MLRIALAFFILSYTTSLHAQFSRYIVTFKNKAGTPFTIANPGAYLSQAAIDRRTKYGVIIDSTDLPIPPAYLNQVKAVANVSLLNASKWLNQVSISTSDAAAIITIRNLSFVKAVDAIAARIEAPINTYNKFVEEITPLPPVAGKPAGLKGDYYNYGNYAGNEIQLHQAKFLHNIGLRGKGMVLALLDAGYYNFSKLRSFDSARINGQILSTWDFVALESNVENDDTHGMSCLSIIAANVPGLFVGKAPQASFHLFRTEDAGTEYPIEEHNWACGAERADSAGCMVISSSLGYTTFDNPIFDHTYAHMNGNTCMSSIAADVAARKGMLVVVAAGNEGNGSWHYISAPSDADSAVCVGAVNTAGAIGSFSSYGPSPDGQVKPDVASIGVGTIVQTSSTNVMALGNGTSFACPNMAGLATCLWQGFPEFNNMRIIKALREAGDIYTAPNNRTGYGIPDMRKAFSSLLIDYVKTTISHSNCTVSITCNTKAAAGMQLNLQRKSPVDTAFKTISTTTINTPIDFGTQSIQFTDNLLGIPTGTIQYRLQQVIDTSAANGFSIFIDTVTTTLSQACATDNSIQVKITPNPVLDNIGVTLTTLIPFPTLNIAVFDMQGRRILEKVVSQTAGTNTFLIPAGKIASGKYFIKLSDGNMQLAVSSFVKLP